VRKKSDAVIVPQEYLAKFDGIFAKYKHFSFIPLLNEAIRAKDLSPQCITLKKIRKFLLTITHLIIILNS
jgi:hypothetical protein